MREKKKRPYKPPTIRSEKYLSDGPWPARRFSPPSHHSSSLSREFQGIVKKSTEERARDGQ